MQPPAHETPPAGEDLSCGVVLRSSHPEVSGAVRLDSSADLGKTNGLGYTKVQEKTSVLAKDWIIDPAEIDFGRIVAEIETIRTVLPQRDAMEQLTAIVYDDVERHICAGYRDISDDQFWVSGHMPGMPLMPGVVMCEAAAQVLSYHVQTHKLSGVDMVGFGGLDGVKFRGIVRPGDRLLIVIQVTKQRRGRMVQCRFQEFVGETLVCEGEVTGIALPANALQG